MIVCVCKAVSEREVKAVIRCGATCLDSIAKACGAGSDCGSCREELEDMLQDAACGEAKGAARGYVCSAELLQSAAA